MKKIFIVFVFIILSFFLVDNNLEIRSNSAK